MDKRNPNETGWKKWIDNILIFNLFIIIIGALILLVSIFLSANGNRGLYDLFQRLWFPLFIPALSLFFTAILTEAVISNIRNNVN